MKIKANSIDPRVKLILVLCISSLGIIIKDLTYLFQLLTITLIVAVFLGVDLKESLRKLKRILYVILGIAIVQSIFSNEGNELLSIGRFSVLTSYGLSRGIEFILRMMIIVFSASLLLTSNSREIIQGFVQMGMPYELAFMVATGIRFLPIMGEEIKDSLVAIQLRGIELDKIPIRERLSIYTYLLTPIVLSSISKAEKLSMSVEMRGFRAYESRTNYMRLKISKKDYILISMSILFTAVFLIHYLS